MSDCIFKLHSLPFMLKQGIETVVSYKCCLPNSNISVKTDFDTDGLLKLTSHFQVAYFLGKV